MHLAQILSIVSTHLTYAFGQEQSQGHLPWLWCMATCYFEVSWLNIWLHLSSASSALKPERASWETRDHLKGTEDLLFLDNHNCSFWLVLLELMSKHWVVGCPHTLQGLSVMTFSDAQKTRKHSRVISQLPSSFWTKIIKSPSVSMRKLLVFYLYQFFYLYSWHKVHHQL